MAFKKQENIWSMFSVLFITFQFIYHVYGNEAVKGSWDLKQKGVMKTIEVYNNEIIDCVDIYKQPAFNNPLIKDLRMEPSDYPFGIKSKSNLTIEMFQDWHKNGECPEGTIPIRRNKDSSNLYRKKSLPGQQINQSLDLNVWHEYAIVSNAGSAYYGASGIFNLWNPKTEEDEFSLSQLWVISSLDKNNYYNNLTSIEAGWTVNRILFGDNHTRFFIYWTKDGYKTGCYNINCGGFVQLNRKFSFDMPIKLVSTYGGKQWSVSINIFKDKRGDWWLQLHDDIIGYWPASILTHLANEANFIQWGGEIINKRTNNHHTTTQMGSGEFPTQGFSKSCSITNLKVLDNGFNPRDPGYLTKSVSRPTCYDLTLTMNKGTTFGTHIFFGGSGFSPTCQ